MSIPTNLLPPTPIYSPLEDITAAGIAQNNMVKLLAGGKNKRQRGGVSVVVPSLPVPYNDGGAIQSIFARNIQNSMQSTENAQNDNEFLYAGGGYRGSSKRSSRGKRKSKNKSKTKRNKRSRKSKHSRKSRKSRR